MLEAELFSLFERSSDAAFVVTEDGEIRSWNKAAEKLFGYSAGDALARSCDELLGGFGSLGTKVSSARCCAPHSTAEPPEVPSFDLQVRTRSGAHLWVNVSTIFFDEPRLGRRLIVHLARDISQPKRNEEALAKILEVARELTAVSWSSETGAPVAHLSDQERRILRLLAKGATSSQIARELAITLPTLRNHLHGINEKLRTHTRLEAVMHALHRGLI